MAEANSTIEAPTRLVQLTVGGSSQLWQRVGLSFDDHQTCQVGQVTLRLDQDVSLGHLGWAFDPIISSIDGIPSTPRVSASELRPPDHQLVDHVVVMTDSLERTSSAIEECTGLELRRIRDASNGVRQAFHRSGEVVIEVVQTPSVTEPHLWGFVLVTHPFDEVVSQLGENVVSPPKDALQPGRRIATVRRELGLGVNVALISPRQ